MGVCVPKIQARPKIQATPLKKLIINSITQTQIIESHYPYAKTLSTGNANMACREKRSCKFLHPKKCTKFCKFGKSGPKGCNDTKCEFFHPILCRYAIKYSECLDRSCTYTHSSGTSRTKKHPRETEEFHNRRISKNFAATPKKFQSSVPHVFTREKEFRGTVQSNLSENPMDSILNTLRELQENQRRMQTDLNAVRSQHFLQQQPGNAVCCSGHHHGATA